MYLLLDIRNLKWRTQCGRRKSPNSTDFSETSYRGVSRIADHESIVRFPKRKLRIQYAGLKV